MPKRMLVVAYDISNLTKKQVNAVTAAAFAQGEGCTEYPDLHTYEVKVNFTVSTQEELHGILEVGAGL